MTIKVRLTVMKNDKQKLVTAPHFRTKYKAPEEYYCTTGVASDLRHAARAAVQSMINYLEEMKGLKREEAYMLCSVAGDLRMHEVVNQIIEKHVHVLIVVRSICQTTL
jgi:acetamidase/formamidase